MMVETHSLKISPQATKSASQVKSSAASENKTELWSDFPNLSISISSYCMDTTHKTALSFAPNKEMVPPQFDAFETSFVQPYQNPLRYEVSLF